MTRLDLYWGFAYARMADLLANRSRFFVGVVSYLIYVSVYAAIYRAIYAQTDEVGGLRVTEALSYVAVAWMLRSFYTNTLDREMTEDVRRGDIVISLLRPLDYATSLLACAMGEALMRAVLFTLPASLLVFSLYPVQPPQSPLATAGFLLGTVLAFGVYAHVNLLVGILAVFTEHTLGLQRAKNAMMDLLGGVLLPLSFFPLWAQTILFLLPFQAVTYTPVAIYLGEMPVLTGLSVQAVWLLILWGLTRLLWRRALDTLTVQGG